jgi:hypothetical protein
MPHESLFVFLVCTNQIKVFCLCFPIMSALPLRLPQMVTLVNCAGCELKLPPIWARGSLVLGIKTEVFLLPGMLACLILIRGTPFCRSKFCLAYQLLITCLICECVSAWTFLTAYVKYFITAMRKVTNTGIAWKVILSHHYSYLAIFSPGMSSFASF